MSFLQGPLLGLQSLKTLLKLCVLVEEVRKLLVLFQDGRVLQPHFGLRCGEVTLGSLRPDHRVWIAFVGTCDEQREKCKLFVT